MTEFTWRVLKMDVFPLADTQTNVVYMVHWECEAHEVNSDRTYAARANDCTFIDTSDLTNFTEYDNLTEEQVLEWVWASHPKVTWENRLQAAINESKAPLVLALPLPWNK